MTSQPTPPKLPKWLSWLDIVENQVFTLIHDREIYRRIARIIRANPRTHRPNDFVSWMVRNYAGSSAVRVRRLIDRRDDVVSLRRLLEDIASHPKELTRVWFTSHYLDELISLGAADHSFDLFSGRGGPHVDPARVLKQVTKLADACKSVTFYANKRIAHHDPRPDASISRPRIRELDRAIRAIHKSFDFCHFLLRQTVVGNFFPGWGYDWERVFEIAWKPRV